MKIGRFASNLFDSIADGGVKFLNLKRLRGSSVQKLMAISEDLVSHKGVASGLALARELVNRYKSLDQKEKLQFLLELGQNFGPDLESIKNAAVDFVANASEENLSVLSKNIKSNRQKLFNRMIMAPHGTREIVSLREDLLNFLPSHPELKPIDDELRSLLTSWFNPGFLNLKKIDWDTEASILEKIIQYETVHNIANWNDLKSRLVDDKRCFAYFHPALEDEPLIFVEVAITKGITGSIQTIINNNGQVNDDEDTAIFYSINNCQKGLKRIPLGNFLIKMVVTELISELPAIKTFSTLSPIPGFADWVKTELKLDKSEFIPEKDKETFKLLDDPDWQNNKESSELLKKPLIRLCAKYLVEVKRHDKPLNSVARFHFGNGAQLYRINWLGNTSTYGIAKSFGIMVNYLYDLKQIESNHENYVQNNKLAVSRSVRTILG